MLYEGFDAAQNDSDPISLAVYERNRAIEATYNCKISYQYATEQDLEAEFMRLQGTGMTFEVVVLEPHTLVNCASLGLLRDLNAMDGLNLAGKGFDQNSVAQLSLGNSLYFVNGDMNISAMDNTAAILFNQKLWDESKDDVAYKLGDAKYTDLYGLVGAKEWTLDNMLKIAAAVTNDKDPLDGYPLSHENGDTVGYYQYSVAPIYYYHASGGRFSTKDADGYPILDVAFENGAAEQLYNTLYQKLNVSVNPTYPRGISGDRAKAMRSGQTLFSEFLLWDVRRVWHDEVTDFAYGFLPIPTVDAGVDSYSMVNTLTAACFWAIPVKCVNAEYAGRMMEIIAKYSNEALNPKYDQSVACAEVSVIDPCYQTLAQIRATLTYDHVQSYDLYEELHAFEVFRRLGFASENEYDTYITEENLQTAKDFLEDRFAPFKPKEE